MDRNFINDGYTKTGYIAPLKGLHAGLSFQWRPLVVQARAEVFEKVLKAANGREREAISARVMASRIVSWNATESGQAVPVNAESMLRLEPNLFSSLWDVVTSQRPSDVNPEESAPSTDEKDILDALESGKEYAVQLMEATAEAEKN